MNKIEVKQNGKRKEHTAEYTQFTVRDFCPVLYCFVPKKIYREKKAQFMVDNIAERQHIEVGTWER